MATVVFLLPACARFETLFQPDIIQGKNDSREYRHIILENGLNVLLVSDAGTDVAAVSLDVNVGSASDPEHRQGLAHFLEHMLFLGTGKYPDADEYQKFITENAGSHNAYTSFQHTNYFFSIKPDKLEPALDRFSQFFISPLFNEIYVEREKQAVDAEYRANIREEAYRNLDVFREVVNQRHPFHKFSTGNLETLSSVNAPIREDLIHFYKKHYSAGNMALVVLGREELSVLERMARSMFSAIPARDIANNNITQPIFEDSFLPKWLYIKPEREVRQLMLVFPLPEQKAYFRSKPLALIGHVIGHEGKGSLLSFLKKNNWVETLSAGEGMEYSGGTSFAISMQLTKSGMENRDAIILAVFQAIERLRAEGLPHWIFDEVALINGLEFNFSEPTDPQGYVMGLANDMHYYEPRYFLSSAYVLDSYQPQLIRSTLDYLVLRNCLLTLSTDGFETDSFSKFFNTPYRVLDIEEKLKGEILNAGLHDDIRLPGKNTLLPADLSIHKVAPAGSLPEKIVDQKGITQWYKPAEKFLLPKSTAYYSFQKPGLHDSARSAAMLELYVALINDSLAELIYPAQVAGLDFSLYTHAQGVGLRIDGFSDKQSELLEEIIEHIKNARFDDAQFSRVRSGMVRNWQNAEKQLPYKKLMASWQENIQFNAWSRKQKMAAIDTILLPDISGYAKSFWDNMYILAMNNGNVTAAESSAMLDFLSDFIGNTIDDEAHVSILKLENEAFSAVIPSEHNDTGYFLYWQAADDSVSSQARFLIFSTAMESAFFNQLRTEKQLGYVVFETYCPVMSVPGVCFVVQSPSADVSRINEEVFSFLYKSLEDLMSLPDEQLDRYKSAVIQQLVERPKSLQEESGDYWYDLALGFEGFDRKERLVREVESITADSWRDFVSSATRDLYLRMYLLSTGGGLPAGSFREAGDIRQNPSVKSYIYK